MDDLAAALRPVPEQLAAHSGILARHSEVLAEHSETLARHSEQLANITNQLEELPLIRQELLALHRLVAQIGWGLGFAVLAALIGLVVAQA